MQRPRRPHLGGAFSRPGPVAATPGSERIRPSHRHPQSPPNHPPRSTTRHPTDTLEPCTES